MGEYKCKHCNSWHIDWESDICPVTRYTIQDAFKKLLMADTIATKVKQIVLPRYHSLNGHLYVLQQQIKKELKANKKNRREFGFSWHWGFLDKISSEIFIEISWDRKHIYIECKDDNGGSVNLDQLRQELLS